MRHTRHSQRQIGTPLAIEDMALVHLKNRIVSFFTPLVRERLEAAGGRRSAVGGQAARERNTGNWSRPCGDA
ncbi:hypothetical protein [Paraburkholderia kururiensis]|uniref:hypothetical protein n=1 Tax=Paraburkholderia kururiensis TaxID=984307 RepID=UPI001F163BA3|nr:hypothetical protein [Paraburkholderia kururiensis]